MKNYNDAVNQIYAEKEQQIILGLTGRTGAGCSTAAGILKKQFDNLELEYYVDQNENIKEKKAFEIIKEYIASDNRWVPFIVIEGSCVILSIYLSFMKMEKMDFNVLSIILNFFRVRKILIALK